MTLRISIRPVLIFSIFFLMIGSLSFCQFNCDNMGFEQGTLSGWNASRGCHPRTGSFSDDHMARLKPCYQDPSINGICCPVIGPASTLQNASVSDPYSRHTICNLGVDSFGQFSVVPPLVENVIESNYSLRLGNAVEHGEAERIERELVIDNSNAIIAYEYCFLTNENINETPPQELPYFEVKVIDENGLVQSCTNRKHFFGTGYDSVLIGQDPYDVPNNMMVYFQDWQLSFLDLTNYIGETVTLQFTNADGASGLRWGYTYLASGCKEFKLNDTVVCSNSNVSLRSPFPIEGFKILWSTGDTTETLNVSPSATTTYKLTVENRDFLNNELPCTKDFDVTIFVIDSDTPELNDTSICAGSAITIEAQPSGINYNWYYDSIGGSPFNIGSNFTTPPLYNDTYYYVENPFNCNNSTRERVYVDVIDLQVDAGVDDTICNGDSLVLSGSGLGNFKWTPDTWLSESDIATPISKPSESITYLLEVSDDNGICINQDVVTIYVEDLKSRLEAENVCVGEVVDFNDSIGGNLGQIIRSWDFGDGENSTFEDPQHRYLSEGEYTVLFNAESEICNITDTIEVEIYALPNANFSVYPNEADVEDPSFIFKDLSDGAVSGTWDLGDGNSQVYSVGEELNYEYAVPTSLSNSISFNVKLNIVSQFGCTSSFEKEIYITNDITFYMPNSFTPNGDNVNDILVPYGKGIREFDMTIFDRWGRMVYESKGGLEGWDGTFNNSEAVNQGIYLWKIRVIDNTGTESNYLGSINLIK